MFFFARCPRFGSWTFFFVFFIIISFLLVLYFLQPYSASSTSFLPLMPVGFWSNVWLLLREDNDIVSRFSFWKNRTVRRYSPRSWLIPIFLFATWREKSLFCSRCISRRVSCIYWLTVDLHGRTIVDPSVLVGFWYLPWCCYKAFYLLALASTSVYMISFRDNSTTYARGRSRLSCRPLSPKNVRNNCFLLLFLASLGILSRQNEYKNLFPKLGKLCIFSLFFPNVQFWGTSLLALRFYRFGSYWP